MHYLLVGVLWIAALLQLAVIRDRSLPESSFCESGRVLLTAGIAGLALRFSYVLVDQGALNLPLHSLVSLLMSSLGAAVVALGRIIAAPGMIWTKPPAPYFTVPDKFDSQPHHHGRRTGDAAES